MSFDFPLPKDEARNYSCLAFVSIKRLINWEYVESASGSPKSAYHMEQKLVPPKQDCFLFIQALLELVLILSPSTFQSPYNLLLFPFIPSQTRSLVFLVAIFSYDWQNGNTANI